MIQKETLISNAEQLKVQLTRIWSKLDTAGVQYIGDEPNVVISGYEEAEIRVLIGRLSSYEATRPSMTIPLLYQIIQENTKGVFADRSYLPPKKDLELFEANRIPLYFGITSKQPARSFDVLAISNAIIMENINFARLLNSSGIDLMFSERMKDPGAPIVLIGGCNVRNVEYLFGDYSEAPFTGTGGMVDAAVLGAGEETLPAFLEYVKKAKRAGQDKKTTLINMLSEKAVEGLYLPWMYDAVYEGKKLVKTTPKPEYVGIAPTLVKAATVMIDTKRPLTRDFISYVGSNGCADIEISRGCGVGTCAFCQECMTERPYSQRSFEDLKRYYNEARIYQGAEEAGAYCFNWSSHTQIYELLKHLYEEFGRVGLISNRIDMIHDNKELLKISYFLGNRHWTTGIEGCSERLRAALHKGATEPMILKAVHDAMEIGFNEIKLFFIATGREEPSDIQECCDMLQKIYDIREKLGKKCFVRMSFTPLFSKSFTPLQWQEILPALNLNADTLRAVVEKCQVLGFGFRTSCKRSEIRISNLLEQGDRRLTPLLIKSSIYDGFIYYGNVPGTEPAKWDIRLKDVGLDWLDYFSIKAVDNVFPWDHLHFGIDKPWLLKRYNMWLNYEERQSCLGHRKLEEVDGMVQMNEVGLPKWSLVKGKCEGCKACPTSKYIKDLTQATLSNTQMGDAYAVNQLGTYKKGTNAVLRLKYDIDEIHAGVPKNVWPRVIARAFMLSNEYAPESFNKCMRVTMTQLADEEKQPIFGVDYADIGMTEFVPAKALDLKAIQAECRGIRILGVNSAVKMSQFSNGDPWNYYEVFIPADFGVSMDQLTDAFYGVEDRVFTLRRFEMHGKGVKKPVEYKLKGSEVGRFWLFKNRCTLGMRVHMDIDPFQVFASLVEMKRFRVLSLRVQSFGAFRFSDKESCPECQEMLKVGMLGEILPCECCLQ